MWNFVWTTQNIGRISSGATRNYTGFLRDILSCPVKISVKSIPSRPVSCHPIDFEISRLVPPTLKYPVPSHPVRHISTVMILSCPVPLNPLKGTYILIKSTAWKVVMVITFFFSIWIYLHTYIYIYNFFFSHPVVTV